MAELIGRFLERSIQRLKQAGIADAELSARLIFQYRLGRNPVQLQLSANEPLNDSAVVSIKADIENRAGHYPVQYIIGEVEFYNIKLKVNESVLIPRPETEILVEQAIDKAKPCGKPRILDIGVGSGNISIALAANIPNAEITGMDISENAIELANRNAISNGVESRIRFERGDCFDWAIWKAFGKFEMVVSNPPYVDESDYEGLQPEVRLHEPKIALVAENDSLKYYKAIANQLNYVLTDTGRVLFEVGYGQAESVAEILTDSNPRMRIEIITDLNSIPRVVFGELIE
jgi:release factor glutamine methyltransferase